MLKPSLKVLKKNNRIIFIPLFLFLFNTLIAQPVSPFNKLSFNDTVKDYSFIVSGHFHGASTNSSTFPASSLLANIDTLNALDPLFLMSLGDMFQDVNQDYLNQYQKSLFDRLKMPLYNAVGNHDLFNGNMYEKVYGKTFYCFSHSTELFIILDTELDDGNIKNEQLEMLKGALDKAKLGSLKNIFIFSHRPIWAEDNTKYSQVFKENTRSQFGKPNFEKEVLPLLEKSALSIFWISGSMGGGAASFFYDKKENSKITYMQTAIRDLPRDAVLQVFIKQGEVAFKGISFTGQTLEPIENYNLNYWTKNSAPETSFNYRLLPYLTIQLLKHVYFWIGVVSCFFFFLLSRFIFKQWKKRK
jgi:hypothetical protein